MTDMENQDGMEFLPKFAKLPDEKKNYVMGVIDGMAIMAERETTGAGKQSTEAIRPGAI